MTARPLDDVEQIRRLLAPERAARRPVPAPDRPSFRVSVPTTDDDRGPARYVRVYADDRKWRDGFVERMHAAWANAGRDRELVGMPTAQERADRTARALARLATDGPGEPPARLSAVFRQAAYGYGGLAR